MSDNRIALWRKRKGLSQTELAEALGTGRSTVAKLEGGDRRLSETWLKRLGDVLQVPPVELLDAQLFGSPTHSVVEVPVFPLRMASKADPGEVPAFKAKTTVLVSAEHKKIVGFEVDTPELNRVIAPGGIALVDLSDVELKNGSIYVLRPDGGARAGLYEYRDTDGPVRLVPPTTAAGYETAFPDSKGDVHVLGRVFQVMRLL